MDDKNWIKKLKVGDSVFVVESLFVSSYAIKRTEVVTKIGRKYLTLDNRRKVEIKTGMEKRHVHTGISYSDIYPSEEFYLKKLEICRHKEYLSKFFKSQDPKEELIEQIYEIVKNFNN